MSSGPRLREELGQARVEVFEGRRVPFDVATVTVQHVEVDEVA